MSKRISFFKKILINHLKHKKRFETTVEWKKNQSAFSLIPTDTLNVPCFWLLSGCFAHREASVCCRCWGIWDCAKECFIPIGLLRSRGLVQEKDQKPFKLPPLLFCVEHNFKHCTSERTPNTHNTFLPLFMGSENEKRIQQYVVK